MDSREMVAKGTVNDKSKSNSITGTGQVYRTRPADPAFDRVSKATKPHPKYREI